MSKSLIIKELARLNSSAKLLIIKEMTTLNIYLINITLSFK